VAEEQSSSRRSVVPEAAGHSTWLAAIWTGLGAAIVCATLAIFVVAVCWLPVSDTSGRTTSAIRAGLLTFLAAVHGGITVDGVSAAWLPLGMLMIVGLTAWRAGSGLADAAESLGERDPVRLALAGAAQAVSFAVGCLVAVPFATLGTSRAPFLGVAAGALVLFTLTGGTAFVRSSALRDWCAERVPSWVGRCVRCGAAAVAVYLAIGALLVAGSLVVHHDTVEMLSRQVGGGWGGLPILLLGILAAPNAAIAGSSYLAGPGFAVGSGTTVSLFSTAHGTLPAFPVLAAVPTGAGANPVVWTVAVATPLLAGVAIARLAARADGWWTRLGCVAGGALSAGVLMLVLGWQAGGAVGDARLHTVGPSPWLLGAAVTAAVAVATLLVSGVGIGVSATWHAVRRDDGDDDEVSFDDLLPPKKRTRLVVLARRADDADDAESDGELAG
jgi:Family of unknown function (DUF6350)